MKNIKDRKRLDELIAKRDRLRNDFVRADNDTRLQFAPKVHQARKEARNSGYLLFYLMLAYGILWLLLYKQIDNLYVLLLFIVIALGIIIYGYMCYQKYKKKSFLEKDWENACNIDNKINEESKKLHVLAVKTAIGLMCQYEYFYELNSIEDKTQRKQKWIIRIQNIQEAIDDEYNQKATYDDVLAYFYAWEERLISLQTNEEGE